MEEIMIIEMKSHRSGEKRLVSFLEFDEILEEAEEDDSVLSQYPYVKAYIKDSGYVLFQGVYQDGAFKVECNNMGRVLN